MPSVPSYLQAYLQPGGGGLGTSGGVQYNTYRTPSNQIFTPDGKALTPGATPSDLPNYGIEDRGRPGSPLLNQDYAGMNYHERQKQYWIDQFGSDEGWNQFGGGQFDNRQDRRDARTKFYQDQWDQRMGGGGGGAPPPGTRQAGNRVEPQNMQNNQLSGPVNALQAQNFNGLQGNNLTNALQGMQNPQGQPGQGGKGGGAGMPGGFQPYRGQQPRIAQYGQEGSGKSGGQGLPKQPAGQMQF